MRILTSGGHVIVNFDRTSLIRIVNESNYYVLVADQYMPGNGIGGNGVGMGQYNTYEEAKSALDAILTCEQPYFRMPPSTHKA